MTEKQALKSTPVFSPIHVFVYLNMHVYSKFVLKKEDIKFIGLVLNFRDTWGDVTLKFSQKPNFE
jgi:hypothetical protein